MRYELNISGSSHKLHESEHDDNEARFIFTTTGRETRENGRVKQHTLSPSPLLLDILFRLGMHWPVCFAQCCCVL